MATPAFKITLITNYGGYSSEEIKKSLINIHNYLNNKSSLSEQDLIISNFAVSHFNAQSQLIQINIKDIQGVLNLKKIDLEKSKPDIFQKIYNIFYPVGSTDQPVKITYEAIDDDFIEISCEEQQHRSASSSIYEDKNLNHVYQCIPPSKFTDEELMQVMGTFHPFTLSKDDHLARQTEENENVIKASQKNIISSLGAALFEDYLPDVVLWFKTKFIESLKDPSLALRLSSFAEKKKEILDIDNTAKSASVQGPTLLQRALFKQAQKSLEGIQETLKDVLANEKDRDEFPSIVCKFMPEYILKDMSAESRKLLNFIFQFYLPSILKASISSLQSVLAEPTQQSNLGQYLETFLINFGSDLKIDTIELVAYVIQHNIAAPAEKGAEELIKKIQDKELNKKLMVLLNNVLIDLFYLQPGPVNENIKKILVSVLTSLHDFLILLNNARANWTSDKACDIAELIHQHLCSTGKIIHKLKTDSVDLLDLNVRYQIEELLWIVLFPKKNVDPLKASISMKIMIVILSTYFQKIISALFTSDYLYIFLEKILKDPISIDNPFEYNLPSEKLFNSDDASFSKALDFQIKGILSQILKLGSSKGLVQNVKEKLVELMPAVGDSIQKKLNKAFNTPIPMSPILLIIQLAYQVSEGKFPEKKIEAAVSVENLLSAQERFFTALKISRTPSFKSIKSESSEAAKKRQAKINSIFEENSRILEEKVAQFAPFGTQNFVVGTINNLFAIGKNDLILKEILFFLLNGLNSGLKQ